MAVRTLQVQEEPIRRTTLQPATVRAFFESEIKPMTTGYVDEIRADIGDVVKKDDVLLTIATPEELKQSEVMRSRVFRMEAEERRAEAGVTLAQAKVSAAQADLAETRSRLRSVEASLAAAQAEFDRTQDLVNRGSLQQRMLDEVTKKRDSESAALAAVQSSIQSSQANVEVAKAQLLASQADLQAAEAETAISKRQLEQLEVLIDYATIRSPIDGLITMRNVEPGNRVSRSDESATPLMVVSQLNRVRIHIPIPEVDASWVSPGDPVSITFPSFANEAPIVASVTRQTNALDVGTRTMLVEVELENEEGKLLPGMFGQASIELEAESPVARLPSRAIRFNEEGQAYVYIVRDDRTVLVTPVETGADDGHRIELVSGVSVGEEVIDAHLQRFTDGQVVSVIDKP
ncbi:MAG: efflux RND transporter periplasmic adaptor subunit [Planctomycetota bacterium]